MMFWRDFCKRKLTESTFYESWCIALGAKTGRTAFDFHVGGVGRALDGSISVLNSAFDFVVPLHLDPTTIRTSFLFDSSSSQPCRMHPQSFI